LTGSPSHASGRHEPAARVVDRGSSEAAEPRVLGIATEPGQGTFRARADDYPLSAAFRRADRWSRARAVNQRELVERAQRGDHDAFAVLAGAFVARLDAAARLILRDHDLARDAVQEGFIRAWRSLPSLRDPDRFEAWLRSLVARSCLDILRRRSRRAIEVELGPTDGPSLDDVSAATADRDLLDMVLRRLPPEGRAVVVLRYYFDLEVPEIAASLAIPVGTVKATVHRSMALMRTVLADIDPEHAPLPKGQLA